MIQGFITNEIKNLNLASYQLRIAGAVQGQGIRPALARFAEVQSLTGRVCNTSHGVLLTLHGVCVSAVQLEQQIRAAHPALAAATIFIDDLEPATDADFQIDSSTADGATSVPVPRDVAICPQCLSEFHSAGDRRFHHGLINCTACGPRFSIIQTLPYDRSRTTLSDFPLCAACRRDYESPAQLRRHAQTIGCGDCGPQVWVTDRHGRQLAAGDAACRVAALALRERQIVALRGVGGYQLLVDATNEAAVALLRQRKRRSSKPFAVLCRTLSSAEQLGVLDDVARQSLTAPANPIVIVPRRWNLSLAAGIHPGLNDIGLMLPTTAMHDRLLQLTETPLVCTSGNVEGSPLVVEVGEALSELNDIADLQVHHNRPIRHPLDDSVIRPMAGRPVTIRCARGLAPLPLNLTVTEPIVAAGAFQKAAMACANGSQAVLGPYVGDLTDLSTRDRWQQSLYSLLELYQLNPALYVTDGHPDDIARRLLPAGPRFVTVWHHHAHIAAGMLEHDLLDESVIGIAADGQGFGPDGQLWGLEVLEARATGFRRLATMRPYALPGGEAAVFDPGRVAFSLLSQLSDVSALEMADVVGFSSQRLSALSAAIRMKATPWTSSLGRLFDAVAWLILGNQPPGYIGELAARLEAVCDPGATGIYEWELRVEQQPWQLDWRPMLTGLLRDRRQGVCPGMMAERFHRGVANVMRKVYGRCPPRPLVPGGGVFQNRRLCELLAMDWPAHGPKLGLPGIIPPNDSGLAAGQLAIVSALRRQYGGDSIAVRKEEVCAWACPDGFIAGSTVRN